MKLITMIFIMLLTSGCSSLRPVEMPPEQLRQEISVGDLIQVGDTVRIVTTDSESHKFKVTAITADQVSGKNIDIAIPDILEVDTKEFSRGKTTALAGSAYLIYILGALAAAATIGL